MATSPMPAFDSGPFGDVDGARADPRQIERDYISRRTNVDSASIQEQPLDLDRLRVIVGDKGVGKSLVLRRAMARVMSSGYIDETAYTNTVQQGLPLTVQVRRVATWARSENATERWALIWRYAIFRSIVTHLLGDGRLRDQVGSDIVSELEDDYGELYRVRRRPLSIYSQVTEILHEHENNRQDLWHYLMLPAWNDLGAALSEALTRTSPMYFFVDSVDERFDEAPQQWLECQKGLFLTVMHLLRDDQFGGRLHLVICVRDFVLSDMLQTEHANRYRWSPYIQTIWWDDASLRHLLRTKIQRLPEAYLTLPSMKAKEPVAAWLGRATIRDPARDYAEDAEDYLLRHTRMTPRDIVLLGNCLCAALRNNRSSRDASAPENVIREAVNELADALGAEQIRICANEISAAMFAHDPEVEDAKAYADALDRRLRDFIAHHLPRERLTTADIEQAREAADTEFHGRIDILSILWQNGLLGFGRSASPSSDVSFYRPHGRGAQLTLPRGKPSYALHSCLLNTLGL